MKNNITCYKEKIGLLINKIINCEEKGASLKNKIANCHEKMFSLKNNKTEISQTICNETSSASFVLLIILLIIIGVLILFKYQNKIFGCQKIEIESLRLLLTKDRRFS